MPLRSKVCNHVFEDECNLIIHVDNGLIPIFIFFPYLLVHVHNENDYSKLNNEENGIQL
jgi:hypothetical protein